VLELGTMATEASTAFLLATGATTGASAAIQPFTLGVKTGKIATLADSTNAFGLYRANGTTQDFYYDSTNGRIGIGVASPAYPLDIGSSMQVGTAIIAKGGTWIAIFGGQVQCGATDVGSAGGIGYAGSNTVLAAGGGVSLAFRIGGTEYMRLTNAGLFAVGQTSATAQLDISASTTTRASLRIRHGVAPTTPNDGDMWTSTAGLFVRINGVTVGPLT